VASGRFTTLPEVTPLSPEQDARSTKRALARVLLPKKVERLKAEVTAQKAELATLKRRKTPEGKSALWKCVRAAKEANPAKASDQGYVTRYVDSLLAKSRKELRDVCPASWKKMPDLPCLLSYARKHPRLKGRIKTYISKVTVS